MLNLRLIFFITFLLTLSVLPAEIDQILLQADQYYRDNDFSSAIREYEKLVSAGYEGPSLHYNLGNSYYRIGKLGFAILNYEKALKLSPNDEDIKHNLTLANLQTMDKIETLPKFFLFEWWESFLKFFSVNTSIIIALVVYFLFLLSIALYFFAGNIVHPRISFFSGMAILLLFVFLVTIVAVKINRENKRQEAIIVENSVVVKLSPDQQGKVGFLIHEGLKVLLEDKIDDWRKIRLPDGKVGWVPVQSIRQI